MSAVISQEADDLIVACEVGSRAQYEKLYRHPEWPGGASGVTIGIGYDLGYADKPKVYRDWGDRLPSSMIDAMVPCLGRTGEDAHNLTTAVRNKIDVPWEQATFVYEHHDIPEWTDRVCNAIPGADKLQADCLGSLTSLAYNRGASFQNQGDRYREMRAIRSHIMAGELPAVSGEIRAMKRLWGTGQRGLLIRRDKEAALWDEGLKRGQLNVPSSPPIPSKPKENPPPLTPAAPAGTPEIGTGGTGAVITGKAAHEAAQAGWSPALVATVVGVGLVVTVATIAYVRYRRTQPVLARQKG